MKRLSLFATLVAAALVAAALSLGSSHREAPNTSQDPTADDTDVYAFTANDAPGSLTVLLRKHRDEQPVRPTTTNGGCRGGGGAGGDGGPRQLDFHTDLILAQAQTLYRKWPEVEVDYW